MLTPLRRYVRAFVLALGYTLRGEKPPLLKVRDQYPELAAWWERTIRLVEAVERSASASGVDPAALIIHVERRDISMATILRAVKYHAEREYPYLMAHDDDFRQITLRAINMNDRHLVMRLSDSVGVGIRNSVDALAAHLAAPPSAAP